MSTSKIEICNIALSHLGSERVTTLTGGTLTEPARLCNIMYDPSRQYVLQDHEWGFATILAYLSTIDTTSTGYEYTYQYPNGCLQAREIYQDSEGEKPIDFEIRANPALVTRHILTDQDDAILVYTGDITNTNMFSPAFVMALTYHLASLLAIPISKKTSMRDKMIQYYTVYMEKAKLLDALQMKYSVQQKNDFLTTRGYSG